MGVLSMWRPQDDVALQFIYFAKRNGALGPVEEREEGVLRSRQHPGTEPMSTFTLGARGPRMLWYHWTIDFYSPAGPNTINHIFRHMQGLWPMDWRTTSKNTEEKLKALVSPDSVTSHDCISKAISTLSACVVIWWSCSQQLHLLLMWPWFKSLWNAVLCDFLKFLQPPCQDKNPAELQCVRTTEYGGPQWFMYVWQCTDKAEPWKSRNYVVERIQRL